MSWTRPNGTRFSASTALRHFSTACWAWKPTEASETVGDAASTRNASISRSATVRYSRARSIGCFMQHPALAQGLVEEASRQVAPGGDILLGDNDHIGGDI